MRGHFGAGVVTSRGLKCWMVAAVAVMSLGSIACMSTPAFAAGVVSGVTVSPVPSNAGLGSIYTVNFTTATPLSPLALPADSITLTAPAGTTLPTSPGSYAVSSTGGPSAVSTVTRHVAERDHHPVGRGAGGSGDGDHHRCHQSHRRRIRLHLLGEHLAGLGRDQLGLYHHPRVRRHRRQRRRADRRRQHRVHHLPFGHGAGPVRQSRLHLGDLLGLRPRVPAGPSSRRTARPRPWPPTPAGWRRRARSPPTARLAPTRSRSRPPGSRPPPC